MLLLLCTSPYNYVNGYMEYIHTTIGRHDCTINEIKNIINPRRMREGYGSRSVCVCVSVCLSATTLISFASPNCNVIRFLMAFQTHDLCGFCSECFIR